MKSKKAVLVGTLIVVIVIAIIVGVILLFGVIKPIAAEIPTTFNDRLCNINAGIRGAMWAGKIIVPLWFCGEDKVAIDATDWSRCDPKYKKEKNKKACASQQLAELAMRCWYRYGQDNWDMARINWDYYCFRVKVKNLGEEKINEKAVTDQLDCKYLSNNDCDPGPGNGGCGGCDGKDAMFWEFHWDQCKINKDEWWTIQYHDHVVEEEWSGFLGIIGKTVKIKIFNDQINFQEVADAWKCYD